MAAGRGKKFWTMIHCNEGKIGTAEMLFIAKGMEKMGHHAGGETGGAKQRGDPRTGKGRCTLNSTHLKVPKSGVCRNITKRARKDRIHLHEAAAWGTSYEDKGKGTV